MNTLYRPTTSDKELGFVVAALAIQMACAFINVWWKITMILNYGTYPSIMIAITHSELIV